MHKETANYKTAKDAANKTIVSNDITAPPIPLEDIANSEGLTVAVATFKDNSISGFIDFEKKMIIVNQYDSPSRQKFTIAHELGHWILHQEELECNRDLIVFYRKAIKGETDPLEREANCFAANLLVPDSFLKKFLDQSKTNKDLANIFQVSESVIAYRRNLINE